MKKRTLIDSALMPDGSAILLYEHDGTYSVRVNGAELMSTRRHASEDRIAELACLHTKHIRRARVLIGGLGFGFTLKAALACLPADAAVTVAEISPAVIAWNRNSAFPLAAAALADPRVTVAEQDVGDVIAGFPGAFDSIILDIDNGPAALSTESNRGLYNLAGLNRTYAALRPAGCAAFWSAAPNHAFAKLMATAGFEVDVQRCRAHTNSGGWHTLFLGRAVAVRR
jgi:spermidine synthase